MTPTERKAPSAAAAPQPATAATAQPQKPGLHSVSQAQQEGDVAPKNHVEAEADVEVDSQAKANAEPERKLSVAEVVSSVFAAGLGVQSSKNRQRDFEKGRAGSFIVAGIIFTALFIGAVYTVVSVVLAGR